MGKRLLLLGVHVEQAAEGLASEYARTLGMHVVSTARRETPKGTTDAVVMAGAEVMPYLGVFSGKGPASAANRVLDVFAPGLTRLVFLTDEYARDAAWLRARGPVTEDTVEVGANALGHATAVVAELGAIVDVIEEPDPSCTHRELLSAVVGALMRADRLTFVLAACAVRDRGPIPRAEPMQPATPAGGPLADAELDHVAIYVSDMAAADRVVRDFLGQEYVSDLRIPLKVSPLFARTFRDPSPQPRTRFVITLCASERGRVPDWIASHGGPGVHHLAHRVEDLDGALKLACDAGATQLSAIAEVEWLRQVMLRVTTDGFLHELICRTDDRALDEANALRLIETQ